MNKSLEADEAQSRNEIMTTLTERIMLLGGCGAKVSPSARLSDDLGIAGADAEELYFLTEDHFKVSPDRYFNTAYFPVESGMLSLWKSVYDWWTGYRRLRSVTLDELIKEIVRLQEKPKVPREPGASSR